VHIGSASFSSDGVERRTSNLSSSANFASRILGPFGKTRIVAAYSCRFFGSAVMVGVCVRRWMFRFPGSEGEMVMMYVEIASSLFCSGSLRVSFESPVVRARKEIALLYVSQADFFW